MKKVQTNCNFCAMDCNLDFQVEDGKILRAVPTKGYPVNDGFCCIKGISLDKQQTTEKPGPLPWIRQPDGSKKTVSWDEAFHYVADKLKSLQAEYGTESVAGISTGQLTLEEFSIFGHVMRNYLQTNVDGNTRLCMATAAVAMKQSYGFDAPGYTLKDLELSDTIILIGANPIVTHPIFWSRIRNNEVPGHKVIVIDPRRSETARMSDVHYQIRPRADLKLLYTLANVLIKSDWIDHDFIEKHTDHFGEFREFVKKFTLEDAEKETGLTMAQVMQLAASIHEGKAVSMWWTMGVNQGYEAVRTAQAIINICLMTGNIGRPGTGPNSITGQCNAMGSRLFSDTTCLYAGYDFKDAAAREKICRIIGTDDDHLAKKPTLTYDRIVEGINDGKIKGLWILCTNPMHSWANNKRFEEAVKKLDLYVVQDIYDSTDSAEKATVFFPVVPGIKKCGTYINLERRMCRMVPVLPREKDEISDYEAVLGVGRALGMGDKIEKWATVEDCFNLMKEISRNTPCDFTGIDWKELEGSHGCQWPFPEAMKGQAAEDERRLYADGKFFTPDGRAQFLFEDPLPNPFPQTEEFPYIFNTGRGTVGQWHTQTRTREVRYVEDASIRRAYLFMNTKLAQEKGIRDLDFIRVDSVNGQSAVFMVRVTDDVPYDQLYAPEHYLECNRITPSSYDKYSKEPNYKAGVVNFVKVGKED